MGRFADGLYIHIYIYIYISQAVAESDQCFFLLWARGGGAILVAVDPGVPGLAVASAGRDTIRASCPLPHLAGRVHDCPG